MSVYRNKPELVWPYSVQGHNVIDSVVPDPPPVDPPGTPLWCLTAPSLLWEETISELSIVGEARVSPDGSKLFVVGFDSGTFLGSLVQYSLDTPYDIRTRTLDTIIAFDDGSWFGLWGFTFSEDGLGLYLSSFGGGAITRYSLNSAFDLMGGYTEGGSLFLPFSVGALSVSPDELVVTVFELSRVYAIDMVTPGDITSGVVRAQPWDYPILNNLRGGVWHPNGLQFFTSTASTQTIEEFTCTTPYDLLSITPTGVTFNHGIGSAEGVHAVNDNLYLNGELGTSIFQYAIPCP